VLALSVSLPLHAGRAKPDRLPPSRSVRLSNGMEVILIPNRAAPLITSVVIVRAGLANETPRTNGVSHMLEHLLFNGTQRRTQEALYAEQDRYGIINNASTGPAHTAYFVMAARAQFHRALDLQSDMLFFSTIPEDKLEKERGIIANEIAKDRAAASSSLDDLYDSAMYRGTLLSLPVIGTPESVRAISREEILAYYRARYVPNNMTAIVMGDFDMEEIEPLVKLCFGTAAPGLVTASPVVEPPDGGADHSLGGTSWSRPTQGPARLIALGAPAPGPASSVFGPVWMLASLLSEDLAAPVNARLAASGVAGRLVSAEVAYLARGSAASLRAHAVLDEGLPAAQASAALSAEITERARTATTGGKPWRSETLARLRLEEKATLMRLWEKPHYFGLDRAPVVAVAGWDRARDLPRQLEFVEVSDIRDAARRYAAPTAWASFYAGAEAPATAPEPAPAIELPEPVPTSESRNAVSEWKGTHREASARRGAEPAPLAARTGAASDATNARLILANGLLVNIDFTNDSRVFAAHVLVKNRAAAEPPERAGIADLLHRVAGSGTRRHPGSALQDALRALGGTLKVTDDPTPYDDIYLSPEYSYFRLEALDEHAAAALELLAEILAEPDLGDGGAIETARGQVAARSRQAAASPGEQARLELARGLWGDTHPFARPLFGTETSIKAITHDDLVAFHRSYFHPRNIILGIGTSMTPEGFLPALHAKLGYWSTNGSPPRPAGPPGPPTADFSVRRAAVTSTQASLALGRLAPADSGSDAAWTALAAVLSRRMGDVLREQRGLSYSLGAEAASLAGQRKIMATMGTLPDKVSEAEAGMREVLASLVLRPAEQSEIDDSQRATEVRLIMRALSRINRAWSRCVSELRGAGRPSAAAAAAAGSEEIGVLTRKLLADERLSGWVEAIAAAPAVAADHP